MRVLLTAVFLGSALIGACSGDTEPLLRSNGAVANGSNGSKKPAGSSGDSAPSPADTQAPAPTATPTPAPAPTPSATPPSTPATPPTPPASAPTGSCASPKCAAGGGLAGCKATDSAGDLVTMGCQDGECACFANDGTSTGFEATIVTADDASSAFLTNCTCN